MATLLQDLRFALRTLRRSPVFVAVAVLSLALGIGANTAIFTLMDRVMLRLIAVKDAEQLVLFTGRGQHYGSNNGYSMLSYPMYADFRDHNEVFSGMFCRRRNDFSLSFNGRTERINGELVSGTYFPVLGVHAALGRVFSPEDDKTPGGHPYIVLSYRFWVNRFAADPSIIGQKFIVNGYPLTVVGVSEAGFDGIDPGSAPQIRIPVVMKLQMDQDGYYNLTDRRGRWVNVYGRMKPGLTIDRAKAALQPFFHQILGMEVQEKAFAKAAPVTKENFLKMWIDLTPAGRGNTGYQRQYANPLLVLMALVGVVLLIACANVANLLIARATARQKEIAVRLALGASRARIVSQLLVESTMIALAGGCVGLALSVWIDRILISFLPQSTAIFTIDARPDSRILLFNLGVSLVTGLLFGLVPALQSTRPNIAPTLKDQAGNVSSGPSVLFRKALVIAQVALSLLLLIASGLFIRTLTNLRSVDPGFRTRNLIQFQLSPPLNGYKQAQSREIYRQLSDALNTLPGVESSALALMPVLTGNEWDSSVTIESYAAKPGEYPDPHMNFVSPGYFHTLNVPVLLGRDFSAKDNELDAPKAAIVDEKFAKKYFADGNPIGRHIGMGGDAGTKTDIEIVGVVADTKYESLREEAPIEVYRPYRQMEFTNGMYAYVRTVREPEDLFGGIRQVARQIDANVPISELRTLERQLDNSLLTDRLVASLSSAFGILATILASIGLYGVMAYSVARRTREIGIRMALGAAGTDVLGLVMKDVALLTGIGIAIALPVAWGLTGLIRKQLYGIQPTDPITVAFAVFGILLVALSAGYIPARRAVRIDPIRALRWE